MKIGDKVRFLSEAGGGKVAGFQGKNIVLVEDSDGFQIPTAINDVVVIENEDYSVSRMVNEAKEKLESKDDKNLPKEEEELKDEDFQDIEELPGGDVLSIYLAFVPIDIKHLSSTKFETYIVNDSNYYISYTYLFRKGTHYHLQSLGQVEPNTKLYIEEFSKEDLDSFERVSIQLIAYKKGKDFLLKSPVDVRLRLDQTKFYKLHSFKENEFFEQLSLIYPLIENDKPSKELVFDAEQIRQQMIAKYKEDLPKHHSIKQDKKEDLTAPLVVDLHANELLDSTKGLTSSDILNYQLSKFREVMQQNRNLQGKKIIFIHGKGEGVLRSAILNELKYRYKKCTFQDASFREYGFGATQVNIR